MGMGAEVDPGLKRQGNRYAVDPYTPLTTTVRSEFNLSAFRACDSFLQSSSPEQECASSILCFEQKCPWQKLQSPTIR